MGLGDSLKYTVGLDLTTAERQLRGFGRLASGIGGAVNDLRANALSIGATLGAGLGAGALALKSIMDTGGQMEAFTGRLTIIMGSASEAKARMGELFDFAASTPFELDQVVGADVTLRGFGASADELLPKLIDFSAALGTDLTQSAIDFGKAWSQGGAGLESDTGKILKSMIEAEAGIKTADMSIEQFRENMTKVLDDRFAGGAEKLSRSFVGMMSNLNDEWARFKLMVSDAGLFNNVKGALQVTLSMIADNREAIGDLASAVSGGLWEAFKLAALGAASVVDAIRGAEVIINSAAAATSLFAASLADAAAMFARGFGGSGSVVAGLEAVAAQSRAFAASSMETVDGIVMQATAIDTVTAALAKAEEAAAGFKAEVGPEGGAKGGTATAAGAGGADTGTDPLIAKMDAALAFSDQMATLNQSDLERERATYAERMDMLLQYNEEHLVTGELFAATRLEIERSYEDAVNKMREDSASKERERQRMLATTTIGMVAGTIDSLATLFKEGNEKQSSMAKALAYTQIAIGAAVGIAEAWSKYWEMPVIAAAATAEIGAATAVQIAAVSKAHQGTGPDSDERDTRMLRSEAVLNSQATRALGPQGVEALNSGRGAGPQEIVVNLGRTQTREMQREEVRSGGPMTRFARGLFASATAGKDVGFSGRLAFA